MPAPNVEITIGDRGPASPTPGDVGALFLIGVTDRGPVGSTLARLSLGAFKATYGDDPSLSFVQRSVEAYFREGGTRVYASRVVGPDATTATLDLDDGVADPVLVVTAVSPGDWAHELTVTITTTTGDIRTVVLTQAGVPVASVTTDDPAAVIDALEDTGLVIVTEGAGTWPVVNLAATALAGGDDDRAAITITEHEAALAVFEDEELPVGSLAAPGVTLPALHEALLTHAETYKRFALLDVVDTPTVGTLTVAAGNLRDLGKTAGYGQFLAPWEKVPGPGRTTVTIPPSGAQAGRMARSDRQSPTGPGQVAGARFALSKWSTDVTQEWELEDRDTLSEAGVTVIRNIRGAVQMYDGLTLADPDTWPQYAEANGMRVVLAIYSECLPVMQRRVLETIDGRGILLGSLKKDLVGVCSRWYERNALYGATANDAFVVDTGPGVNPPEQLALRQVNAKIELRTSPFASQVDLLITKVAASDII